MPTPKSLAQAAFILATIEGRGWYFSLQEETTEGPLQLNLCSMELDNNCLKDAVDLDMLGDLIDLNEEVSVSLAALLGQDDELLVNRANELLRQQPLTVTLEESQEELATNLERELLTHGSLGGVLVAVWVSWAAEMIELNPYYELTQFFDPAALAAIETLESPQKPLVPDQPEELFPDEKKINFGEFGFLGS